MISVTRLFQRRPAPTRMALATRRADERPSWAQAERQKSASDNLYFAVRSMAANGARHTLQYAFADDRGNTVFSGLVAAPSPVGNGAANAGEDLAVEPFEPEVFDALLTKICGGARLVAFGRVLQAGLLPRPCLEQAADIECAWRRFLQIGRQRGLAFDRTAPLTLSDALVSAGLEPPGSSDAAERALAVRRLWSWMDRVDLESDLDDIPAREKRVILVNIPNSLS